MGKKNSINKAGGTSRAVCAFAVGSACDACTIIYCAQNQYLIKKKIYFRMFLHISEKEASS